jgi:hypothetical protein
MGTKIVMLFNINTEGTPIAVPTGIGLTAGTVSVPSSKRVGSFSETVWSDSLDQVQISNYMRTSLGPKRARLLPRSAELFACRLYTAGAGKGTLVSMNLVGGTFVTDIPQMALLCQSNNPAAPVQRRFFVHAIPDTYVVGGEFSPSASYASLLADYFVGLQSVWFQGITRSTTATIFNVQADGTVMFTGPVTYTQGTIIQVSRTVTASGRKVGGPYAVASVGPGANQVKLTGWQWGVTNGGTTFIKGQQLYSIGGGAGVSIRHIGTRRIGRPFEKFIGRRSKRPH